MMEEYELFDILLSKTKTLRDFCDDREKMMFEIIRMDLSKEGKIHWLEPIGSEVDRILKYIDRCTDDRKSHLDLKK